MVRLSYLLSLVFLTVLALLAMSCTKEVEVEVEKIVEVEKEVKSVELKVPVAFGTHLPSLGDGILYISERLESISGGSLTMTVHEPGELVAANEILDAVSTGKTNAGYATAGYWVGKMPSAPLFSAVPFGPDAAEYLAWLYYDDGMDLYQQMYDDAGYNVHVLLAAIIPPETSGWFADPIESTSDLDGLRMRFFGLGAVVMQKFGVQTSLLPGGEIYAALEKGAIDATEFSLPVVDQRLGFHKLVKHNYYPGWHQQATTFELLINKDVWNGLTDQQRMILEVITKASVADSFAHGEALEGAEIKKNVTEFGVINHYWSDEMLAEYEKAWLEVVEEQKAADPFFKTVWDDFSAFDAEYKYWASIGYLPRPAAPE
ncbi:MAG: TRAP transporter substrate-binding protein [SAR202 cluster bacterium]|nr:TRAP transporter substrate-binding protein [SAR202 cluster bacterium]